MKKLTYVVIALMTLSLASCSIFKGGNKSFEGYISYSIDYEGDIPDEALASLPTTLKEFYKGTKVRKDQETAMFSMGIITDNATEETTILMDIPMMGEKIAFKQTKEESDKAKEEMEEEAKAEYNETTETKEILGYSCKKTEVTLGEDTYAVFYTNDIVPEANPNTSGQFSEINGVILEYTISQQGMIMHFTATEVKKQKNDDALFGIPDDYTLKTAEEMNALMGM